MSQTQNENIRELPQTTTLPIRDYYINLLKAAGFGIAIGTVNMLVIVYTNWYYLAGLGFLTLCWNNWWLLPAILTLIGLALFIDRPWRRKRKGGGQKRKEQTQAQAKSSA
jgi:hypothetical protein